MSREAMQMALEALESDPVSHAGLVNRKQAITALRQALEEKRKPVFWTVSTGWVYGDDTSQERGDETAKNRLDKENIIRMAREAGISESHAQGMQGFLERFVTLVAAAEREACAAVCDVLAVHPEYASDITKVAAQAIRARGNK